MWLYFRVCACSLVGFTSRMSVIWTSPVIPKLTGLVDPENNPLRRPLTTTEVSWVAAFVMIGGAISPWLSCHTIDKIGRKRTLQVFALPAIASYAAMCFFPHVVVYCLGRFLIGISFGTAFSVLPTYLAEVSEPKNRGSVLCYMSIFICLGLLYSYCVGPYVSINVFNCTCIVPYCLFLLASVTIIPESPHFLIANRRTTEGERTLRKLRIKSLDELQKELLEIENLANENRSGCSSLVKSMGVRKALIICIGLVFFQQFSGINVILSYLQTTFEAAGSSFSSETSSIIVGVVQMITSLVATYLVDKMGRRPLLMVSAIGSSAGHAGLGLYFLLRTSNYDVTSISWLPIASIITYIIFFNTGLSPITWTLTGELFPTNVKAMATTIATSICMLMSCLTMVTFPLVTEAFGSATSFFLFGVFCALAFVFVAVFVPETKGISLVEVQELLHSGGLKHVGQTRIG